MPTFILVLQNDGPKTHWLARKSATSEVALRPCTYNSANNQVFQKNAADKVTAGPCPKLTDENGNQADAVMVQLANSGI